MNVNNKIVLTNTTGKPVLTYKIYYWDYRPVQPVKTLLYVGKAYNFNNAATIDIYVNDIIKNIPRTSGYYDILAMTHGIASYGLNLVSNLEVYVDETNLTSTYSIYQDNTKSYIAVDDLTDLEPGDAVSIPNTFNTLNKLHGGTDRQLNIVVIGNFDNDEKMWGLKYVYTDGTTAQHLIGTTNIQNISSHRVAVKFTCTEDYAFNNDPSKLVPQVRKKVKELWLQYDATGVQEFKIIQFTNDDCEYDVLSFENRNGSISYLQLKGNTIYSESIQRYMKIDMFDKETMYASLVDESITINTGWLTDAEAKALEDLYVSKKIYLFDAKLGMYLAVNVDETNYTRRTFKNERQLKNYTIKLKLQEKEVL